MHLELKWYFSWNQKFEKTKQIKKVREINRIYYLYLKWNRFTIVPLHQMMFQFFMDQFFGMIAIQSFVDTAWNCLIFVNNTVRAGGYVFFVKLEKKCLPVGADTSLLEASMLFMVVSCKRSRPEMPEAICALLFFLL